MIWIVTTPSAYRMNHECFLGKGSTKNEALEDAYGPRESWSNATRRAIKAANARQVSEDEAREYEMQN